MRMTIDIKLHNANHDLDIDTIAAYLGAILRQQTGAYVQTHIIDSEFVNPIKLARALRMGGRFSGEYDK